MAFSAQAREFFCELQCSTVVFHIAALLASAKKKCAFPSPFWLKPGELLTSRSVVPCPAALANQTGVSQRMPRGAPVALPVQLGTRASLQIQFFHGVPLLPRSSLQGEVDAQPMESMESMRLDNDGLQLLQEL